ncbi:D-tagatose-bisphosphate aldolase, class II, non-catalytic subunit [Thalassotalea marina]|uniref:Tagatose-bisphosphate aldolase subunit KbaZ n=1 Tax=Thalassotalea marina TaxID=1673741 RepID=A0A919BM24_9GAMM|nr:D-tagatose-bisphosphate aldolase, class II, non-catalytic subunit [Thalassotalea marina]GHG00779.1 tagatose-bisphosphate aldolase subunit KbaZ [Thalassotalea marina]
MKYLLSKIQENRETGQGGIYSVCCAHPLVIKAAMMQAVKDGQSVLIESTANQVNQFGGYTGMKPIDFVNFVYDIADELDFPRERIILGGDHLGPVCWVDKGAEEAIELSKDLIAEYVKAGFKKIHLDTSMACFGDPQAVPEEEIAYRASVLCKVAEQTAIETFGYSDLLYVVGTEVPVPGGETEAIESVEVTSTASVDLTLKHHYDAFKALGLEKAISRIIAIVVQPGVEFDHTQVVDYQPEEAKALAKHIEKIDNIVFEAHSTDYQKNDAYKALVSDHFAILKVGPQLTFALREGLFALSYIEEYLVAPEKRSYLRDVCEQTMLAEPANWKKYYQVPASLEPFYRHYSFSDRIRYYWANDRVNQAVKRMMQNLSEVDIPLPLVSQFLPEQFQAIRNGKLSLDAQALVIDKIMQVTSVYSNACQTNNAQEKAIA